MTTARVNGVELYYEEAGEGVPCIVLHGGLGFDHTIMKRTLQPLEDVLRMFYVDQRCNGRSERAPIESIAQLAADVEALRVRLELERIAVMGHSYGGFVALEYATTFSKHLSHLALLDTSPGVFEPTEDELAQRPAPDPAMEAKSRWAAEVFQPSATDEEMLAQTPGMFTVFVRDEPHDGLLEIVSETIVSAAAAKRGFEILEGWSVEADLDRIDAPTLVVQGRYDLFCPPECGARLASRIPGAELAMFENSAHFPVVEEPGPFFAVVRDWLARHP